MSPPTRHPDHEVEQERIDETVAQIDDLISVKTTPSDIGLDARTDRLVAEQRGGAAKVLESMSSRPYFGRIDREDGTALYVGKAFVPRPGGGMPMVISWHSDAAKAWYEASPEEPMGCVRRRHLTIEERVLRSIGDEELVGLPEQTVLPTLETTTVRPLRPAAEPRGQPAGDAGPRDKVEEQAELSQGPKAPVSPEEVEAIVDAKRPSIDAVLEALEQDRDGAMADIVASIQADQHRLITEPIDGMLVVQGGPGTGKTAVALHRAAWLLYTYRDTLSRDGVLVVGPNRAFMEYIRRVLPALGEDGVTQLSVDRLSIEDVRASVEEPRETQRLKGDPRMVKVLAKAARGRLGRPRQDVQIDLAPGERVTVTPDAVSEVVRAVLAEKRPYLVARDRFRGRLEARAYQDYLAQRPARASSRDFGEFARVLRASRRWQGLIRTVWPTLSPEALVHELLHDPTVRERATRDILTEEEADCLDREGSDTQTWSVADLALLDEANFQLNGVTARFGYVIVDEAQDLTPMQLRAVTRRAAGGRMTLVGDIAQATGPWPYLDWSELATYLPQGDGARIAELLFGYRVPREVMDVAVGLLPTIAPNAVMPTAVRAGASVPTFRRVLQADLAITLVEEVQLIAERQPGTVAVIGGPSAVPALQSALEGAGVGVGELVRDGLERRITVLASSRAKGLEFDSVVVVEPAGIGAEGDHGLSELYVALTRATRHLSVIHALDLPSQLPPGLDTGPPTATSPLRALPSTIDLTARFSEALVLARLTHGEDRRRGTAVPYMAHLLGTAALVLHDGGQEDEVIAALLHDAAEDHGGDAMVERIRRSFGDDVADIVRACSDPFDADDLSWEESKRLHRERLDQAGPAVRRVSLAEKVDNVESILRDHNAYGDDVWARMDIDPHALVEHYRDLADLFLREHPGGLASELDRLVRELETRVSTAPVPSGDPDGELWSEFAEMPLEHVREAYTRGSIFFRELLEHLAAHPDERSTYADVEASLGWPRGRLASVLGGQANVARDRWDRMRPFHIYRDGEGTWSIWMDGLRADAVLDAATVPVA